MAKSKNHSTHNQGHKNHKNGIYRPPSHKFQSLNCVNAKYLRNRRRGIKFDSRQNKHVARYQKSEDVKK